MERAGLRFSHNQHSSQYSGQRAPLTQIDGYLQLMRFTQKNEELSSKNHLLEDKLHRMNDKAEAALKAHELRKKDEIKEINTENKQLLDSKQSIIDVLTSEKKALQKEKDQLLDYVERSEAKERE